MQLFTWLALLLLGLCWSPSRASLYDTSPTVKSLRSASDLKLLESSDHLWIVQVFRPTCRFCVAFSREFAKAADTLHRLVMFAAVDRTQHDDLVQRLQRRYQIEVKGVPTTLSFVPTGEPGQKDVRKFRANREAAELVKFALAHMPNFSRLVYATSLQSFLGSSPQPKALFFTSHAMSGMTPPVLKSLSSYFRHRVLVGEVKAADKQLEDRFAVERRPCAVTLDAGGRALRTHYPERLLRIDEAVRWMDEFLNTTASAATTGGRRSKVEL